MLASVPALMTASVGIGRGGGVGTGAVGSKCLNNASRSPGLTGGAVTAATTRLAGTHTGLSTVNNVLDGSLRWNTIEMPSQGTVLMTSDEPVPYEPKLRV